MWVGMSESMALIPMVSVGTGGKEKFSFHWGWTRTRNKREAPGGGCGESVLASVSPRVTPAVPPRCTHRTTRCDLPPAPRTHGGAAGPIAAQPQEAPLLYLSLAVSEFSTLLHSNCSLCQEDRAINLVFAAPFTCPTNACLAVKLHC